MERSFVELEKGVVEKTVVGWHIVEHGHQADGRTEWNFVADERKQDNSIEGRRRRKKLRYVLTVIFLHIFDG